MSTRGIDVRQETDRIVFRVSLKDVNGAKVVSGTTEIRVYRVNDNGTLDVLDWTTFGFVAPGSGTPDDEEVMTHRVRRDSSGADVNTGIWTAILSTLTNFTEGQVYIAQITNTNAVPESQEREFQFGGVEGSSRFARSVRCIAIGVVGTGSTVGNIVLSSIIPDITVTDQFKGLNVHFPDDTTTAALRGQATDILGTSTTGVGELAVTDLTTAPQSGDLVIIQ